MPLSKVNVQPGVNTQATQTQNAGRWSLSNLIRWKDGFLEKIGGWQQLTATQVTGKSRGLHAFEDLDGNKYLLTGSNTAAQVYFNGALYTFTLLGTVHDLVTPFLHSAGLLAPTEYIITDPAHGQTAGTTFYFNIPATVDGVAFYPKAYVISTVLSVDAFNFIALSIHSTSVDDSGNPPLFGTVANDPDIEVLFANHGLNAGDTFNVDLSSSLGGVTLFGPYIVQTVIDQDTFIINAPSPPTSTAAMYENQIDVLNPLGQISYATPVPASTTNWSFDNFGQIGLLSPNNGPLLAWTPPISNLNAVGVLNAPTINGGMFVAMPQAQVISYASEVNGIQDLLLARFSDAGNYTNWTADATNQAGSFRLSRGSKIVGGLQAPQVSLLWTDIDLWSMQYVGPPFVYSFNILQSGCGLIAQRAATVLYGTTYWMSQKQFFQFGSSGVSVLPCDVWDAVFGDLDPDFVDLTFAGSNASFNEIMFYYASESGDAGEIDSYVKYNVVSHLWDYGKLDRTSWIDQSVLGSPIGVDSNEIIQQHEIGYDANGVAMSDVFAESGFVDLGEGSDIIFVDQIIPDFKWFGTGGYVIVTLYAQSYPGGLVNTYGPYTVNQSTRFLSMRTRARQVAFRVEWGEATGFSARMGANRLRTGPAGRVP